LNKKQWETLKLKEAEFPFIKLVWGQSGNSFAYLQEIDKDSSGLRLHFYKIHSKSKGYHLNRSNIEFVKDNLEFSDSMLLISRDDKKIFFKTVFKGETYEVGKEVEDDLVQVWHVNDKIIYPRRQASNLHMTKDFTWVWWPATNKLLQLGTSEHPNVVVSSDFNHSLSYNLWDNEPQYKYKADLDFYITDLATEKKRFLVDNVAYHGKYLSLSEDGKYLKYFKDGDWWIYDINAKGYKNLTKGLKTDWFYPFKGNKENPMPYGSPGWIDDTSSVLIYDKYDL